MSEFERDLDARLRAAGARLRADLPGPPEIDEAFGRVQGRPTPRSPWRWLGPAIVVGAAAAAVVGVLVVTQPEDSLRQVPADATVPSTSTPPPDTGAVVGPATVPGPVVSPAPATTASPSTSTAPTAPTAPAASPTTTSTTTTTVAAAPGWTVEVVAADFDGDGGACVEVTGSPGGERVAGGCIGGPQVRAGRPAYAVAPGGAVLGVTTDGSTAAAEQLAGDDPLVACVAPAGGGDRLVDVAACTGAAAVYARLATGPDGANEWATSGFAGSAVPPVVHPADVAAPDGIDVFEVTGSVGGDDLHCALVVAAGVPGWRESCEPAGQARAVIGGAADRPVLVELDGGGRVQTVTALDPDLAPLANGCRVGVGTLLSPFPPGAAMTGLHCVDGAAIGGLGRVLVRGDGPSDGGITLQRDAGDGTWPVGDSGPSLTCAKYAATCAAFGASGELGEAMLPIPPRGVLADLGAGGLGGELLDPVDVTDRFSAVAPAPDVEALSSAVVDVWRRDGEDATQFAETFYDRSPFVVTVTSIPDDALGAALQVVWYSPAPGGVGIDHVVEILSCRRGVTTIGDGTQVCV